MSYSGSKQVRTGEQDMVDWQQITDAINSEFDTRMSPGQIERLFAATTKAVNETVSVAASDRGIAGQVLKSRDLIESQPRDMHGRRRRYE